MIDLIEDVKKTCGLIESRIAGLSAFNGHKHIFVGHRGKIHVGLALEHVAGIPFPLYQYIPTGADTTTAYAWKPSDLSDDQLNQSTGRRYTADWNASSAERWFKLNDHETVVASPQVFLRHGIETFVFDGVNVIIDPDLSQYNFTVNEKEA